MSEQWPPGPEPYAGGYPGPPRRRRTTMIGVMGVVILVAVGAIGGAVVASLMADDDVSRLDATTDSAAVGLVTDDGGTQGDGDDPDDAADANGGPEADPGEGTDGEGQEGGDSGAQAGGDERDEPNAAEPTPTPEPTATPRPEPTATPRPTSTPVPTATPRPAPTATPTPAPTAAPTPIPPTPTPAGVALLRSGVSVWSAPFRNGSVLTTYNGDPAQANLQLTGGSDGGWVTARLNGVEGWVYSAYINATPPFRNGAIVRTNSPAPQVLRRDGSPDPRTVGSGELLLILNVEGNLYHMLPPDGRTLYLRQSDVQVLICGTNFC